MNDINEIEALKASYRGVRTTAAALQALEARVEGLDARGEIAPADLEDLSRVALAHAVASQALRGLIETMRTRRGG